MKKQAVSLREGYFGDYFVQNLSSTYLNGLVLLFLVIVEVY